MKRSPQRIFARCKVPTLEYIEEQSVRLAKLKNSSREKELDLWLRGVIYGIGESTERILREKSRMKKLYKIKKRILSVSNYGASFKMKEITHRFYSDLLQSVITASRQKMCSKL